MPIVYVVQESRGKNLLPAQKFGDVQVLLPPGQIVFSPGPTIARLHSLLNKYGDDDYLLLLGDPAAIGLAAAIAANYNGGRLQFLKYDRQEKQYFPIKARLFGKGESGE